jgi:hypothetical protein
MDDSEFSYDNLNTLCWAAGSLSGTLPNDGFIYIYRGKKIFYKNIKRFVKLGRYKKRKRSKSYYSFKYNVHGWLIL